MRQCPDRDAFRAGRNLPDKEFRYLRTVIVTAAVHRGFGSELAPLPLTFRHWAGITPYTSPHGLSRELWFCYPVARAWTLRLPHAPPASGFTLTQHPFFRRYGVNLPSSLTRGHSSALVCSTCLPVSVCGTVTRHLPSWHFSAAQVPRHRSTEVDLRITSRSTSAGFELRSPYRLARSSSLRGDSPSASSIGQTMAAWYRNMRLLSIAFAIRLRLRPD